MQIFKKYKKTSIILLISTILLISFLVYLLITKIKEKNIKIIENKPISYDQNPETFQAYNTALQIWKDQCYFKPGNNYTGDEIRKAIGRTNKTLYCLDNGSIFASYKGEGGSVYSTQDYNYKFDYTYLTSPKKT